MVADQTELGAAVTEAEQMMELGRPITYGTVQTLLTALSDAGALIDQLRSERDQWQEAYCEARLEARRRDH